MPEGDPQDYLQQPGIALGVQAGTQPPPPPPPQQEIPPEIANLRPPPMPAMPRYQNIPQAPHHEFSDPIKAFQNPAVVLATLGSLFTRAPMTAALNAGGAAMEAFHKGDMQTAEQKRKEWEDAFKQAEAQNKLEQEKYKEAWFRRDVEISQKFAEMAALAAGFDDPMMLTAAKLGLADLIEKMWIGRETAKYRSQQIDQEMQGRMEQIKEQERIRMEQIKEQEKARLEQIREQGKFRLAEAELRSRGRTVAQTQKQQQQQQQLDSVVNQIDRVQQIIKNHPDASVVGVGGWLNRAGEFLSGGSDFGEFEQLIRTIQTQTPRALTGVGRISAAERKNIDTIVPGLGFLRNTQQVYNELEKLKKIFQRKDLLEPEIQDDPLGSLTNDQIIEELKRRGEF